MPYVGIDAKNDIRLNATSDLDLTSDSTTIKFGADDDVTLTHVHNTGLLLNSTNQLQFGDSGTYIRQSSDSVLNLVADGDMVITADGVVIGASSTSTVFEATGSKNDQWAGKFTNTNSGGYGVLAITAGSTANEKAFEVRKNTSDTALLIKGDGNATFGGDVAVECGTNARLAIVDNVGEVGSGNLALQVGNTAQDALKPMGFRAEDIRFATGSSERMRIDSSGNFLVAKTSSDGGVVGFETRTTGETFATASATASLYAKRLGSGTNDNGDVIVIQNNDGTVGTIGTNSYGEYNISSEANLTLTQKDSTDRNINFGTDHFGPFIGEGDAVDLGRSNAKFRNLYLSGGVYVGGTGSANLLDDYEEGTYTPNLLISGSTSGISINSSNGTYTKIGRLVVASLRINLDNKGSNSGNITVTLPLTCQNANVQHGTATVPYLFNWTALTDGNVGIAAAQNSTQANLFHTHSGSNLTGDTNINNNSQIAVTVSYVTD